ncbi:Rap1a/Tai family immunity protein [uncultured Agrobacterium sp.]|uniref:Rap1a/Tai family immunity protein n=1 Tax=uncultured Agrobacterium sp. TaxID=157277 RepID=UPI00344CE2E4
MRLSVLAIALGLLAPVQAHAQVTFYVTGASLLTACEKDSLFCIGYVTGVIDGLTWGQPTTLCIPDEVKNTQLVRVVKKYLQDNPGRLHLNATVQIADAVQGTWPCQK